MDGYIAKNDNAFCVLETAMIILLGIFFMVLMAYKKIPIPATSIKMSLQSLSISMLVITLNKKAFWITLFYLMMATLGLPVLAEGMSNSKWYMLPSAGYYFGFLISSYVLAKVLKKFKPKNFFKAWILFSLNESLILFCGYIALIFYVGAIQAWWIGVWPYVFGACLKITTATCLYYIIISRRIIFSKIIKIT